MAEKLKMPKGRLRLRDDSESPFIGLWTWKTEPNTIMAALEQNFLAVIETAGHVSARRKELEATGKFTASGVVDQLIPAAMDIAVRPLRKAENVIVRAKAEIAERRARLKLKDPDKTDLLGELQRQEVRTWLRNLPQAERDRMFNGGGERVDPMIIETVISAPPGLSGVAASNLELMKQRLLEAQFPGEMEHLADLEKAVEATERAVNVNTAEIMNELGVMKENFSELAKPVLAEVDAAAAAEMKAMKSLNGLS